MGKEDFLTLIEEQFLDLDERLTFETRFHDLSSWDSMTALSIVNAVKSDYGIDVDLMQMKQCATIDDLYHLVLGDHGVKIAARSDEISLDFGTLSDLKTNNLLARLDDKYGILTVGEEMRCALMANPFANDEDVCQFVASKEGVAFGGNVNIPGLLKVGGRICRTWISSCTQVAEEYRSTGFGLELWNHCLAQSPEGIVTAGSCSQMKVAVSQSTGCNVFLMPRLIMLFKSRVYLETKLSGLVGSVAQTITDFALWIYWRLIGFATWIGIGTAHLVNVSPVDDEIIRVVADIVRADSHDCAEVHDERWIKWHLTYSFSKDGPMRLVAVKKGGRIVGFMMVKRRYHSQASHRGYKNVWLSSVMEWGSLPGFERLIDCAILNVCAQMRKNCDAVEMVVPNHSRQERCLRHLFWRHVGDGNFIFKIAKGNCLDADQKILDAANWRLRPAMGDGGMN